MQTPSPAAAIIVASLEQIEELERHGRRVLMRDGYAGLARQAADLYCAFVSLQSDGVKGADAVDNSALEDACSVLQRLAAEARSAA